MADLMANRGAMLPEAPERDWEGLTALVDDKIHQKPEKGKITQISREVSDSLNSCCWFIYRLVGTGRDGSLLG